ncbi:MAG: hypothetical protein KJO29_09285 [Bacteroidia bacterium]|nr:hypothetical protein [Bacteroidia bacterium]
MSGNSLITYLLILVCTTQWVQGNATQQANSVDSLKNIIASCNQAEEPGLYLELVKEIKNTSNDRDSIWHYLEKALSSSVLAKDQKSSVEALRLMAFQAGKKGDYRGAEAYFKKGIALAKENQDSIGLADTYYTKARYHFSIADQEGFVNEILKAIDLYDMLEERNKKGKALITLGIQYARNKKIELALEKLNEAKAIESYFTTEVKLYLSLHLGKNYRRLASMNEDDSLLVKAIEILENGKTEAENASIIAITVYFYIDLMDS